MREFLKKTGLFFLPLILLAVIFEIMLRGIPNDYAFKRQFLDLNAERVEALFLGSSQAFQGIKPEVLPLSGFNAAHGSQALEHDFAILKKYERSWKRLKYVVVPVSYLTLFYDPYQWEPWKAKNYVLYYGLRGERYGLFDNTEIFSSRLSENLGRWAKYYLGRRSDLSCTLTGYGFRNSVREAPGVPVCVGEEHALCHFELRGQNVPEMGVLSGQAKLRLLEDTGRAAALRHTRNDKRIFQDNMAWLKSIIDWAAERDVTVILYTPPVYKTYARYIEPRQMEQTLKAIEGFSQNPGVRYSNFFLDGSFTDEDFLDADHLNGSGADKFTRKLYSFMVSNVAKK